MYVVVGRMIMNQLSLANSSTHLVLEDKLSICNGDVFKIAPFISFILLFDSVFHVQDDLLIVSQPSNHTQKHESWDSKKRVTT
jgi:hypothetical protein